MCYCTVLYILESLHFKEQKASTGNYAPGVKVDSSRQIYSYTVGEGKVEADVMQLRNHFGFPFFSL